MALAASQRRLRWLVIVGAVLLLILWFKIGEDSKITLIAIGAALAIVPTPASYGTTTPR